MAEAGERLVVIGEIARAHGLDGAVRVTPLTDHPERFETVDECVVWDAAADVRERRRITSARRHGSVLVVSLAGCRSVEEAAALAGRLIALPESQALPLPAGQFYPWQLEGCAVVTEDGTAVGTVSGIESTGAQDWWLVRGAREHMIPAVPAIVIDVDLAARRVIIRPPDGLLEL